MRDRSERSQLQATLGDLASVHAYQWRIDDLEHAGMGWWCTPNFAIESCSCDLCAAARRGQDVYLGPVARIAHFNAGRLVGEHLTAVA